MKALVLVWALCAAPFLISAESYVTPVATARVNGRVYSTTTAIRNDSSVVVSCEAIYAVSNAPNGRTLRAKYEIGAGETLVEHDTLMEAGALGTMRFVCSGPTFIVARLLTSADGGKTFDNGRIFPAASEANVLSPTTSVETTTDLLVMEVEGASTPFEITVRDRLGTPVGARKYDLQSFAQQLINLSKILPGSPTVTVEIRSGTDAGGLVISRPTNAPELIALTERRVPQTAGTAESRIATAAVAAMADSTPPAIQQIVSASFKAAPLRDPATGLVYKRDRWYDPTTGSFVTPDPEGHRDSPNLYAYCGGDPVNCSDPTGRAAFLSRSGWIVATDNQNGHRIHRFSPEEIAKDPVGVRRFIGLRSNVSAAVADDIMFRAGYGAWFNNTALTQVARNVSAGVDDIGRHVASTFVSSLPVVGEGADARQVVTGFDPIARERLTTGGRVITAVGAALPVVSAKFFREALLESGKSVLRQFDIDYYGTFSHGARVGDQLEGHELLQNLWLEVNQSVKRGSAPVSTMNPAVAVSRDIHVAIGREQRALGLFDRSKLSGMSATENIELNMLAMRRAGVPEEVIQVLREEALRHAASLR